MTNANLQYELVLLFIHHKKSKESFKYLHFFVCFIYWHFIHLLISLFFLRHILYRGKQIEKSKSFSSSGVLQPAA